MYRHRPKEHYCCAEVASYSGGDSCYDSRCHECDPHAIEWSEHRGDVSDLVRSYGTERRFRKARSDLAKCRT